MLHVPENMTGETFAAQIDYEGESDIDGDSNDEHEHVDDEDDIDMDPEEPVTMISILIRARALIAAAGGGVESEFVRGEQFADLLEEDLSLAQQRRSKLLAWIEALRSPRASAPLPIKSRIWHNLPEGLREQIGEATRSVLRDDARLEGLVPEESFPGI